MRVDTTRHHVTTRGVQNLIARKPLPDFNDLAVLNQNICLVGQVMGDDRSVLDHSGHGNTPRIIEFV